MTDKLTRMLGWASVGLGTPLLLAPAKSVQALGLEDGPRQRATLAGVGVRELLAAAGLLGQGSPVWLWNRVAGDLMDLALLGNALRNRALSPRVVKLVMKKREKERANRTTAAIAAVAAVPAVDVYAAVSRSRDARRTLLGLTATVTVTKPRQEV